jgi:hypothetical protein
MRTISSSVATPPADNTGMIDPFRCQWRCTTLRGMSERPPDVTSSPIFKGELASEER